MTEIKRGELYYADLSPVIGSEQGGVRPVTDNTKRRWKQIFADYNRMRRHKQTDESKTSHAYRTARRRVGA